MKISDSGVNTITMRNSKMLNTFKCILVFCLPMMIAGDMISVTQSSARHSPDLHDSQRRDTLQPFDSHFDADISDFVSQSVLQFAQNVGIHLEKQSPTAKSQIFSPVCLSSALALVLLGAHGETYAELQNLFRANTNQQLIRYPYKLHEEFGFLLEDTLTNEFHTMHRRQHPAWWFTTRANERMEPSGRQASSNEHTIRIANGIFVQNGYSLRPDYKTAAQFVYKSEIAELDFRRNGAMAKDYINDWVKQKTFGKIPSIIADDIQDDTKVIIASSLYFKAFWENSFLDMATMESNFYPDGKTQPPIKVQMMANGGVFPYYDAPEYDCRIMGFPYKGNESTMYLILPNDSSRQKLQQVQALLTADKIEDMISKMVKKTAVLAIPKLHISNTVNLKKTLYDMGVKKLFFNGQSDLSLLADGSQEPNLFVPSPNKHRVLQPVPTNTFSNKFKDGKHKLSVIPLRKNTPNSLEDRLIFTRFGGMEENANSTQTMETNNSTNVNDNEKRTKRSVTYKVESEFRKNSQPLRLKDLILGKRITKLNPGKKLLRNRRELGQDPATNLKNLDSLRSNQNLINPQLFVEDIIHKIDLVINEQGTEAAAATVTYLRRSGTDVVLRADTPFMILIRHDLTKLPLFYGTIYEPTDF